MDLAVGVIASFGFGILLVWLIRSFREWGEHRRKSRTPGTVNVVKAAKKRHNGGHIQ